MEKRRLFFIFTIVLCALLGISFATNIIADESFVAGDVNGDSIVNVDDAKLLLMNYYFPDEYPIRDMDMDFNDDNKEDVNDVSYLYNFLKNPSAYPLNPKSGPTERIITLPYVDYN